MRPVDRTLFQGNQATYNPYSNAKDHLIEALGGFCSYCERPAGRFALAVEHIEDKDKHLSKKYNWDNFLLSCICCNSIKSTKRITGVLLPDRDNTFDVFTYLESGYIEVNQMIGQPLNKQAQALIDLVRLDRIPGNNGYSGSDNLWMVRKQSWELAQRYLIKYEQGNCDKETIKDLALHSGSWSIWMQVFDSFLEVKKELVLSFSGTNQAYFQDIVT